MTRISVSGILVAFIFTFCTSTGQEIGNTFTEKGLSLLGYHLCNYSVTKHVSKMIAYQKSYEKQTPCGGWIPWRVCTKTYYKEEYHAITVPEPMNVTDCCEGYEQVGLYCSLPLNRSSEFASTFGACPEKVEELNASCTIDKDCPERQKCCKTSKGMGCSDPVPEALNRSSEFASTFGACPEKVEELNASCTIDKDCPERQKCCKTSKGMGCSDPVPEEQTVATYWYNVSVLVKMDFKELIRVDPRLLEHSRLLHSMITGALWPLNVSVYHIQTTQAERYAETLTSQALIGLQQPIPLVNLSYLLKDIVMRVYEVIDIDVQGLDSPDILFKTSNTSALITNSTSVSQKTGRSIDSKCYPSAIMEHKIFGVTSSSFEVSWSVEPLLNHTFQIEVYKGKELIQEMETTNMTLDVFGLQAGTIYTVNISYEACGKTIASHRRLKTDALLFGVTIRILNYNFTEQFLNTSTKEYQRFFSIFMTEIEKSFPSNLLALYKMGKLKVQMDSIKAGSVIVKLKMIIEDPQFPKDLSAFDQMISSVHKSSVLQVDPQSSIVEDWDECAHRTENDCCVFAECINTIGSYVCRCRTTTDANPTRPGRNCEGEIVDPVSERIPIFESEGLPVTSVSSLYEAEIRTLTSKHNKATALPLVLRSSGAQESNTSTTDKMVPASQNVNASESDRSNSTLSISETPPQVTEKWASITTPSENLAEQRSTTQDQHGSSLSILPAESNITVYAQGNESLGETSTSGLLPEGNTWKIPTSARYVTEHPTLLNHTIEKKMGTGNSSSSEKKSRSLLPASSEEPSPSSTTIGSPATNCSGFLAMSSHVEGSGPLPVERTVFSNVTSTGFHVVWSTNYTQNPDFQFLLLDGEKLIQKVRTRSSNLTVSGLELGVLYTVKIETEVCEKNSKPAQWKIKTAAQKFSGTVRITNLNYSSGFSNSSSEEYRNFTHLFLTEVHTHLPLYILQQMDAGAIKLLITSVSNGSIVVHFDLLVATNMDASNVSRSFLDAFQHSHCFIIDNSSLSIHDYDECDSEETDCSPNASCSNTYGSYECSCKEGFSNKMSNTFFSICAAADIHRKHQNSMVVPSIYSNTSTNMPALDKEDSSRTLANTTSGTAVTKVPTQPRLSDHSSAQVSSLPVTKSVQKLSIKNAVRVVCEIEKVVITIQKLFLQQEAIPESSLYLGEPHCNVSISNSSHVILRTGWNECGTEVHTNTTHTIVKTVLRNDMSSLGVIHHLKVVGPVHCIFQNDLLTSSGYTPEGVYTIFEDLHGSGHFLTEMQLFIGNSLIPKNFSISASDDIMIEVGIRKEDSKLKVVVSECWATPSNNSMDLISFPFIHGSCPVPNTHTAITANGISSKAQFKLKIFSFVNNSVVYLHCKIHICVENLGSTCKTNCKGVRSWRTGETIATPHTSWGPLRKASDDLNEEKKPGLGVGYIVLIVIGVFVLALGIVALLAFRYQRKAGEYNFQIKSDNFSYQVFYE
ncbi:PREDICTED: uromodulin-like 1 [Gekko japonicus]|uniref:Uromodulin-like 1 n=1 Tax=Gekko japonicus TaxID=146911 RepID=A0ABM1K6B2_GEKJA|nr:PREDICTED: uromodulin-like 1 [Gekko japonicus]